ncbi:MAG: hypothetical protein PWQ79_1745 [Thermococcaceae archaeon]|nr:hypothetical protein [Thermococcaceae archaeon]MDK2914830.1 hypothetical protein [Thermococcaceae archaeon]
MKIHRVWAVEPLGREDFIEALSSERAVVVR